MTYLTKARRLIHPALHLLLIKLLVCLTSIPAAAWTGDRAHATAGRSAVPTVAAREAGVPDNQRERALKAMAEGEELRAAWTERSLREAILKYRDAYLTWHSIGSRREAAEALEAAGALHFILSEYQLALDAYHTAMGIRRDLNDELGVIGNLNSIGYTHIYLGQNRQALSHFEQALSRLGRVPAHSDERASKEALLLNSLGEVYYSLSNVKKALDAFKQALGLWTAAGDHRGEALTRLNMGYMYYDFGDLKGASEQYDLSLSLWRALGDRRGEALCLTAKGGVHSFLGEQQTALGLHNEALDTFRSIGDLYGEATTLNGIGTAYEGLNRPQEALDNYEQARYLYGLIGNQDFEALAKFYIGAVYRTAGDAGRAAEFYHQSLSMLREVGDVRLETYVLRDLAMMNSSAGRNREALSQLETVLDLYEKFEDKRGRAHTLNSIGDIHYAAGRISKAHGFYEQAVSLFRKAQDQGSELTTLYKLARAERALGDIDLALSRMDDSTRLIEGMRVKAGAPDFRATYFASARRHHQLYVELLMDMHKRHPTEGYASRALDVSERSRARTLLEMLTEAKVDIRHGADPALVERADALGQSLDAAAEYKIRVLSARRGEEDIGDVDEEIRRLTAEYNETQARIAEQSSLYVALTEPKILTLGDVQAELKNTDTLLLEYALGEERSYLWAVTADSFTSYELPSRQVLEDEAGAVYRALTARQHTEGETQVDYEKRVAEGDEKFWPSVAELSETLLRPVADSLGTRRLIVVVEGALQLIPFETLPVAPSGRGGREWRSVTNRHWPENAVTLVSEHEVSYLQSASMLHALSQKQRPPDSAREGIAILADPVFSKGDSRVKNGPGTQAPKSAPHEGEEQGVELNLPRLPSTLQEAKAISAQAPWGAARVVKDFDVNKAAMMNGKFDGYRILHFATHGVVNDEQPELTGVALSLVDERGEKQSGFLRSPDLYKLNLSADLVVLSACRTALGKQVGGEGFIGLTRGFMYAGARSVLASLWKVDDEATAELMGHFYRAMLIEGLPPPAALRKAKQAMQADSRWSHPFFWAAFALQGEYREKVRIESPWTVYALSALTAVATLVLLYVFVRRRFKGRYRGN